MRTKFVLALLIGWMIILFTQGREWLLTVPPKMQGGAVILVAVTTVVIFILYGNVFASKHPTRSEEHESRDE